MDIFKWIVWWSFLIFTVLLVILWRQKKRQPGNGGWNNNQGIVALASLPRVAFCETIILIWFIFNDFSKLNLIWIYPLVYIIVATITAKGLYDKGIIVK